jgi:chemotaxis signal transduction protein
MFGLSYTQVVEIVSGIEHTQVPSAASHVLGLIAWRGRPVTVVDAGGLLGFEPLAVRPKGRLLITHSPLWQAPVAIPIGEEMQTRTLPLVHRSCLPALPLDLSYARGVFEIGRNEVLIVPNLDAIACPPGHRVV